ncbi:hypothetical protein NP493_6938g00000 [Ridgeia piscesae]|uniref:Metalloendopeptidase n=1 Tax=Ridgeia piscesae TaxID=27915 RepID=A0AAD9MKT5_RIDPI|nr:hypothetical protein NP493_6938g00000 [Ridgeia piscesae]
MVDLRPQTVNLQAGCISNFGTPVHEIGHSLGLWHEQQRWDRDDTVHVLVENLDFYRGQFLKLHNSDLSVPYDVGSVMHYGPRAGSSNGRNTMETINPLYQRNMGQRTGLSFLDAKSVNLAYCSGSCSNRLPRPCERDGYQDPNHCYRCRCPEGFSGTYCHEVAPSVNADCGGTVQATSTPQYIQSPGYDTDKHYGNRQQCNWMIKAPANHRVVLTFEDEFGLYCHNEGQCHHWVEVRTGTNLGRQGARFCCYRKPTSVCGARRRRCPLSSGLIGLGGNPNQTIKSPQKDPTTPNPPEKPKLFPQTTKTPTGNKKTQNQKETPQHHNQPFQQKKKTQNTTIFPKKPN